jgi:hypothetical protein
MNELITKKFENQSLAKATEEIVSLQKNVNQSLISVAGIAGEVATSESYKDDGFKSAQEWLMKTFNYKKSTAYTMVKIGKEYLQLEIDACLPIYKTIFANPETDEDFTLTQLEKLLPLGKEKIEAYLSTGDLKYSMTVKEIKDFVSMIKSLEKKSEESETETETETEPETEIETEPETEPETETETETEPETECLEIIGIYNNCIFVNNEKYEFSDLNKVIKYIRETVKKLNK